MPRALQAMEIVAAVAGDDANPAVIASEIRNVLMAVSPRSCLEEGFSGQEMMDSKNYRIRNWSCHADTDHSGTV
jgi:hypothetical protein